MQAIHKLIMLAILTYFITDCHHVQRVHLSFLTEGQTGDVPVGLQLEKLSKISQPRVDTAVLSGVGLPEPNRTLHSRSNASEGIFPSVKQELPRHVVAKKEKFQTNVDQARRNAGLVLIELEPTTRGEENEKVVNRYYFWARIFLEK